MKTEDDGLRPEYDLDKLGRGVRGKYYRQATYNEWLRRKVGDSMAAASRGETVPDDDVRAMASTKGKRLKRSKA